MLVKVIIANLDVVITNVSGVIDTKYRRIALRSVLVLKPLKLGYTYVFAPPGKMVTDAMTDGDIGT